MTLTGGFASFSEERRLRFQLETRTLEELRGMLEKFPEGSAIRTLVAEIIETREKKS
jgi:hypothetical protein